MIETRLQRMYFVFVKSENCSFNPPEVQKKWHQVTSTSKNVLSTGRDCMSISVCVFQFHCAYKIKWEFEFIFRRHQIWMRHLCCILPSKLRKTAFLIEFMFVRKGVEFTICNGNNIQPGFLYDKSFQEFLRKLYSTIAKILVRQILGISPQSPLFNIL